MRVDLYPSSQLGSKDNIIDQAVNGDCVVTLANGPFFQDRGIQDFGVLFAPYLFEGWEDLEKVVDSDWFEGKAEELEQNVGLKILTTWRYGIRHTITKKPVNAVSDLKGRKIRVQQSPASVDMVNAFGAAAAPMGFGEVYTAIQQGVIDGAENNELALTNNKHGEVAKYFSYTKHQMVPDMLVGNLKFLNSLSDEELAVFKEAARLSTEEELSCWDDQVEEAKQIAENDMGVTFIDVDISEFSNKVSNVQQEMLDANPDIQDLYDHIQAINAEYEEGSAQ